MAKTVEVLIQGFQFNNGNPLSIDVGDSVVWTNRDSVPHTVTGTSGEYPFELGTVVPGQTSSPVTFLKASGPGGFVYECEFHAGMSGTIRVGVVDEENANDAGGREHDDHDSGGHSGHHHVDPDVHSFVVAGLTPDNIYLSHIPLFSDSRHFYQVVLEAKLGDQAARVAYSRYRQENGDARCIVDPEPFILTEIESGERTSFQGTLNHVASGTPNSALAGASPIDGLTDVQVEIIRVIHFRRLNVDDPFPERLTYLLYGNLREVFLDHYISGAPSFHGVAKLAEVPGFLSHEVINSSPKVTIPSKTFMDVTPKTVRSAFLNNRTHLVYAPPSGVIRPRDPLEKLDSIDVNIGSDSSLRSIKIGKLIYFDIRIINK